MPFYIPEAKVNVLLKYYMQLCHKREIGTVPKTKHFLEIKARELGFSLRAAYYLIAQARRMGLIKKNKKVSLQKRFHVYN